ncbi:MAG: ABC transporter permease, partial [Planctomycetota bacterium]
MSIFKIAWRSIQHRGFGSFLTILSMALGVMLVVSVLSIHGLISDSFRNNSSFGYNILVGARGGSLQLTMNTVYYLSQPVENVPYEFYLAFCDRERREEELQNSFAYQTIENELEALHQCQSSSLGPGSLAASISHFAAEKQILDNYYFQTKCNQDGAYKPYTAVAIPLCLGDSYEIDGSDTFFRCVGTSPDFFNELVLDIDTEAKFEFAQGRAFESKNEQNGYFECVIGALVAKKSGLQVGDILYPTHGDPNDTGAKVHAQGFKVVGILKGTRTPHDRAVFLNMEGFYLMDDHSKPVEDDSVFSDESELVEVDPFAEDETDGDDGEEISTDDEPEINDDSKKIADDDRMLDDEIDKSSPLPIEQREVTSILVRTANDEYGVYGFILPQEINDGKLEKTLNWSNFRPVRAQKAAQAVNPVIEVTKFFEAFIGPIQLLLLALTTMICIVSAISILVGIYNSMNQRKHEIAVMRALGASRGKVMSVMLVESILLACAGGLFGWLAGHGLNVLISPFIEAKTGVGISFFDFAPASPIFA